MSETLKCPKCGQITIQIINHEPISLQGYPVEKKFYGRFQCLQMHCHEVFSGIINVHFKQEDHPLEEINETNRAIAYLKSKGYYTDNLWRIDDVQMYYDCTEAEAMRVLDDALTSGPAFRTIFEQIHNAAFTNNLNKFEDES